jgi:hypothetical protein
MTDAAIPAQSTGSTEPDSGNDGFGGNSRRTALVGPLTALRRKRSFAQDLDRDDLTVA